LIDVLLRRVCDHVTCVAGFYGRPWTMSQRKELFRRWINQRYQMSLCVISSFISPVCVRICHYLPREQKWGLNAYLYAPKDDYKHRMYWRDLYSLEEAGDCQTQALQRVKYPLSFTVFHISSECCETWWL